MDLILGKNIFIEPSLNDAPYLAKMLDGQGDMRGFTVKRSNEEDEQLVIFNSYGFTHHSVATKLFNRRDWLTALIFRLNGEVMVDGLFKSRTILSRAFQKNHEMIIREIYKNLDPNIMPVAVAD